MTCLSYDLMKRTSRLILSILKGSQRKPLTIREISARAALCEKWVRVHIAMLEHAGMIQIDRSEKPYSYEVTWHGWITLF